MSEASGPFRKIDDRVNAPPGRFVPSGVDAQSWIGFEQRIQARRFRALLETIAAASARGDGVAARIALEEARELRPDAPELADIESRVALLPAAMPVAHASRHFHSRAVSAFALLLVGVGLLLAIDFARSGDTLPVETAADSALTVPAALDRAEGAAPAAVIPPAADAEPAPPAAPPEAVVVPVTDAAEPGVSPERNENVEARRQAAPPPPAVPARDATRASRPSALAEASLERAPSGEIPDDFVAPPARRDAPAVQPPPPPRREALLASQPAPSPRRDAVVASPVLPRESQGPLLIRPPQVAEESAVTPAVVAASAVNVPGRQDESLVSSVLERYARAYDSLDASAAREVWPSVDERALARAFAGLESQQVSFDTCRIDVQGEIANASCRGLASYVGKVGNREPRTEPRQWTFELRRDGEAWKIETARTSLMQ